jgi:ferrous-iron efflux pump FieF
LRTRRSGRETHIDLHLLVDPAMSVADAHTLSDAIDRDLAQLTPGAVVPVHMDPDDPTLEDRDLPHRAVDSGLHLHKH